MSQTHLAQKYDLPEMFYIDLWPAGPGFLVAASPEAAAEVAQIRSLGKHAVIEDVLAPLVGSDSIPSLNGPAWKSVHRLISPAFRPANVRTIVGRLARVISGFNEAMVAEAARQELDGAAAVELEDVLSRFVFDANAEALLGPAAAAPAGRAAALDDIRIPMLVRADEERAWNPVRRATLWWRRTAALARSAALLRRQFLDRYDAIRRGDVKVSTCVMDACLMDRVAAEKEAGGPALREDKAWLNMFTSKCVMASPPSTPLSGQTPLSFSPGWELRRW